MRELAPVAACARPRHLHNDTRQGTHGVMTLHVSYTSCCPGGKVVLYFWACFWCSTGAGGGGLATGAASPAGWGRLGGGSPLRPTAGSFACAPALPCARARVMCLLCWGGMGCAVLWVGCAAPSGMPAVAVGRCSGWGAEGVNRGPGWFLLPCQNFQDGPPAATGLFHGPRVVPPPHGPPPRPLVCAGAGAAPAAPLFWVCDKWGHGSRTCVAVKRAGMYV